MRSPSRVTNAVVVATVVAIKSNAITSINCPRSGRLRIEAVNRPAIEGKSAPVVGSGS
jgi:hypothetical protein